MIKWFSPLHNEGNYQAGLNKSGMRIILRGIRGGNLSKLSSWGYKKKPSV